MRKNRTMIKKLSVQQFALLFGTVCVVARPNIVIFLADDMGFDDVSFRGSNNYLTPNIDAFAYSGVILKNMYTPAMCTPSRSALLTGKYPIHTGMQHYVIPNDQPWGLPLNETTIAQIFKQHGYRTSIIGKWHMGMSRRAYAPTERGFDDHFGYLGAYVDYYSQTLYSATKPYARGHDFRDNLVSTRERVGTYVTDLLTEHAVQLIHNHNVEQQPLFLLLSQLAPHAGNEDHPLQAPEEEIQKFAYMKNKNRRTYAAMMSKLDHSLGKVIGALHEKNILDNTIILFLSDNGGPTEGMHSTTASNYPLRGQKNTPWEGGIRSSAAIWAKDLKKLGSIWDQHLYMADLLPTLAAAADIQLDEHLKLDGLDLWQPLRDGEQRIEREIVHNIDDIFNYVSYASGKWKIIIGTTDGGLYDDWLGWVHSQSEIDTRAKHYEDVIRNTTVWQQLEKFNPHAEAINITETRAGLTVVCRYSNVPVKPCLPLKEPCLFDTEQDPCEENNLYAQYKNTDLFKKLMERVNFFRSTAHKPNNKPTDPKCDPKFYNYEWTWWEDEQENMY